MKVFKQILSTNQLKIMLCLLCITTFLSCYEMLFNLIKSEAIFNNGRPKEVGNGEGFLAMIAYFSLVGIAFCLFSAYLNNDFRKNSFPDMSFDNFKDEPQFHNRDWSAFNESCKKEIERLKRILGKTEGEEKIIEVENIRKTRIGIELPTLHNSATLEIDEITNLKNKINQTNGRRAKLENAPNL